MHQLQWRIIGLVTMEVVFWCGIPKINLKYGYMYGRKVNGKNTRMSHGVCIEYYLGTVRHLISMSWITKNLFCCLCTY